MYYLKHNGEKLDICEQDIFTECLACGKEFVVDDFFALTSDEAFDVFGSSLYCGECHNKHRADEKLIADRYGIPVEQVQEIVLSGMNRGITREAALVGARLALSTAHGGNELFSMEDVAAAIGGTVDDVAKMIQDEKISPAFVRPAPGFEFLFQ